MIPKSGNRFWDRIMLKRSTSHASSSPQSNGQTSAGVSVFLCRCRLDARLAAAQQLSHFRGEADMQPAGKAGRIGRK
jgi:hypothetical protein